MKACVIFEFWIINIYFFKLPEFQFFLLYNRDNDATYFVAQSVKDLPAVQETWVRSLGWEDPLEKEMATHSSILAWKISWTEEPGGLQSMGSQRVGHDWATNTYLHLLRPFQAYWSVFNRKDAPFDLGLFDVFLMVRVGLWRSALLSTQISLF